MPRLLVLLACLTGAAAAQELESPPATPGPQRVRVGLVLGGGSARGLAHIGVLQVFEERGIPVDLVAGTSMGACVGSLFASGLSAGEVADVARGINWARIFRGRPDRRQEPVAWRVDDLPAIATLGVRGGRLLAPAAAFSDYRVGRVLFEHLALPGLRAGNDFDRLPIPFRAVATDLRTGERVVLSSGDLPRAVRASMSLPVIFPPVELGGRLLVDGGLVDNVPSGVAREMGADVVIAVDAGAPPTEIGESAGVLDIVNRLTEFMMTRGNYGNAVPADVRIRPDFTGFEGGDFARFDDAIAAGRAAALEAMPRIEALLESRGLSTRAADAVPPPLSAPPAAAVLASVDLAGLDRVEARLVEKRLRVAAGAGFDMSQALAGLDAAWASNLFSSAWLELVPGADGRVSLLANFRERPAVRLGVGLSYNEADNVRGFLRLRNGNLLGLGERLDVALRADSGHARLDAALGNVGLGGGVFGWRVGMRLAEDKPLVYENGDSLGRTRFRQQLFTARLERSVGTLGLLAAGVVAGHAEIDERGGIPFAPRSDSVVKASGRAVFDSLDDRFFPSSGVRVDAEGDHTLPGLGSTLDYGRAAARLEAYAPLGRRGLLEIHAFGGLAGSQTPEYDFFRVGGPELVPGRHRDELWGRWAGAASVGVGLRFGSSWRLVARAGAGNAWDRREDMRLDDLRGGVSLGLAHATPLGPAELDLGVGAGELRVAVALGFQ
jgi:NTE family protein